MAKRRDMVLRLWLLLLMTTGSGVGLSEQPPKHASTQLDVLPSPRAVVSQGGSDSTMGIPAHPRIVCLSSPTATATVRGVAEVLASDLQRLFGLKATLPGDSHQSAGDIVLVLRDELPAADNQEAYQLVVGDRVQITSASRDGLLAGTMTLLQAIHSAGEEHHVKKMEIKDNPARSFRAVMIDVKNQWHSPAELRRMVDLCRFYKVRFLSLHTGEAQWIAAVCEQTASLPEAKRRQLRVYTKEEMDSLITYASKRGVYLFPHNECTPHFGHMVTAMQKDMVPGDKYAGFADELDGNGPFDDYTGQANARWLRVMERAIERSIAQFATAYPDSVLPYYHIGPVQGEGGMSPELAARFVKTITGISSDTKVLFWNGISATDSSLSPFKANCVVVYYDDEFGNADLEAYLKNDWNVINAAWSPLYIVGDSLARPVDRVFHDWAITRQGSDGIPGGYGAITWGSVKEARWKSKDSGRLACYVGDAPSSACESLANSDSGLHGACLEPARMAIRSS